MSRHPRASTGSPAPRRAPRPAAARLFFRRIVRRSIQPLLRPVQAARRTQLAEFVPTPGGLLFLGDSITEGGVWNEWFPDIHVINRGVGGETTAELLARTESVVNDPMAVVMLIGTNDLGAAVPLPAILDNIRAILDTLRRRVPTTPVLVQGVMPRKAGFRAEITFLNAELAVMVEQFGAPVAFVDLWPALATADGTLRPEFTEDDLHLNGLGYRAWVEVLRPAIDRAVGTEPKPTTP